MKLKKTRISAFTLMECLVALLVIASSFTIFDGLSRSLGREVAYQAENKKQDWLIFSEQLRQELDQSQFIKLADNRLYVQKDGQELAFGKSKVDDFRKTDWSGRGYQPMLQNLSSARFTLEGELVRLELVFKDGMERSFVHDMSQAD